MATQWQKLACSTCGGALEYKGELLVCKYCKSTYETQEEISESLVIQLNGANVDKNRFLFDDALEKYSLLLKDYPDNAEANWGAFLCSYGIIYEEDYNGEYKPTCHRLCERPVEKSPYYRYLNDRQKAKAAEIEKLRQRIFAETKKVQPYDVFICYKQNQERGGVSVPTREAKWARDVYETLSRQGLRVFYAEKSLAGSNTDYEPHIYAALRSAKLMFVLTTSLDHLHSVWVANEWKRYVSYIRDGEDKTVRVVYDSIEPYDLPKELQIKQAIDQDGDWMSAIQAAVSETFQQTPQLRKRRAYGEKTYERREVQGVKIEKRELKAFERTVIPATEATQLKTAESMMSVGEYKGAMNILRGVLAMNRACSKGYLDMFLCENACANADAFAYAKAPVQDFTNFEAALASATEGEKKNVLQVLYRRVCNEPQVETFGEYIALPDVPDAEIRALCGKACEKAIATVDEDLFSMLMKAVEDTGTFIRYNYEFGVAVCEKKGKAAGKYFAAVLAVDEGHQPSLLYQYLLKKGVKYKKDLYEQLLKDGDFTEIEKILEYGEFETLRNDLQSVATNALQMKRIKEGVRLADFVLEIIPETKQTLYVDTLEHFKNILFDVGAYAETAKYLDCMLAVNPDDDSAYFEKVLAKNKTNDVLQLVNVVDRIMEDEDFLNAISVRAKVLPDETENLYMRVYKKLVTVKKIVEKTKFPLAQFKERYAPTVQELLNLSSEKIEEDFKKRAVEIRIKANDNTALFSALALAAIGVLLVVFPNIPFGLLHWGWWLGIFLVGGITLFVIGCVMGPKMDENGNWLDENGKKTDGKKSDDEMTPTQIKGIFTALASAAAVILMIISMLASTVDDSKTYHLYSAWDFNMLANLPGAEYADFVVEKDIDFKGGSFKPIPSNDSHLSYRYTGKFDGQGHTLKNIKIKDGQGGFLVQYNSGRIQNLTLENVEVSAGLSYKGGTLIGKNYGTVQNITLKNYKVLVQGAVPVEENVDKYSVFMWHNYFGTVENCRLYNCGVTMQSTGERLGYYVMDSTGSSKRSTWLEKIEVYNEEPLPAGQSVAIVRKTYDRPYYNYLHIGDWVIATPDGYKEFYRSADTEWITSKWGEYPTPCTGFDD